MPIQQQPAGLQSSEHRKAALCALPPPFPFHHQPTQVPSSTAGQQTLISVTPPGTPWLNSSQAGLHSHTTTAPAMRAGLPTRIFVPNAIS